MRISCCFFDTGEIHLVRLNIIFPEDIAIKLANKHNKSRKKKLEREEQKRLDSLLFEGYFAISKEDIKLNADWEKVGLEGWE